MLLPNIDTRIEVCIQAVATFAAAEETLRTTISTMLIATAGAGLRGVPGVDLDHSNSALLPLIGDEIVQLSKGPSVQLALSVDALVLLASSHLGGLSNMLEIFQDYGTASSSMLNNALRQHMIAIPVEASLLPRHLLEVSLGRLRSVGLQLSLEAERATVNLFPVPIPKKVTSGSDSRPVQAKIDADDGPSRGNSGFGYLYHDMQPPLPFAGTQVSSTDDATSVFGTIRGDRKGDPLLACHRREANGGLFPVEGIGMQVITDRTRVALGHLHRLELRYRLALLGGPGYLLGVACLLFGLPGESGFQGFSCFDPCLNKLIRYQSWTRLLESTLRRMMQAHAIFLMLLPAINTHGIERFGKLSKRFLQGHGLFWRGMQLDAYRSIHTKSMSYMSTFLQVRETPVGAFFPPSPFQREGPQKGFLWQD